MIKPNPIYEFDARVTYADTDKMGIVYYGNYFTMFERGRTELMRNMGLRYRDLEENEKVFLPVTETTCRYLSPAYYDDMIRVKTWIKSVGRASIDFSYQITNLETGKVVAEGMTRHPFVNMKWKTVRIPDSIRRKLNT